MNHTEERYTEALYALSSSILVAKGKSTDPRLARWIHDWRESSGRTRLSLSRELGVTKNTVSNWELGQNEPSVEMLVRLSDLATESWKSLFLDHAKGKSGLTGSAIDGIVAMGADLGDVEARQKPKQSPNFASIPLFMGFAGAGDARLNDNEEREGVISVPRSLCAHPEETVCIRISGESMEPTISRDSIVAIDRSQRRIDKLLGRIVAARNDDDGLIVKRLVRIEGRDVLASDNPGYFPKYLDQGWFLIGRVVWWIQTTEGR